ncbi:MAG: hypothetical protein H7Z14_16435 [Anaerolineae bacterium]|nr:hypothetical protein [Phycisphaerae bacterium]
MMRRAIVLSICLLALSCDQRSALVVLEPKGATSEVRMEPIAQLVANRTTHVAVDALGNVYWSQESEDGQDLLFVTGPGGNLPQPTTLSSTSILAAMKPTTPRPDARPAPPTPNKSFPLRPPVKPGGNIQSLAAGFDGALYFYFNGGAGAAVGAQAIGRFDPRTGEIQIVADTQQLATISEMGRSLDLARGELLPCGAVIRLFLRHSDNWAILEFEPNRLPVIGPGQLTRKIRAVRLTDPVELTAPEIELAVGPQIPDPTATRQTARNALLMVDRKFGAIYVVDDSGGAKFLASMVGVSDALSEPAIQPALKSPDGKSPEKSERILFFAADGPTIDPSISARPEPPELVTQYPALLMINTTDGKYTAIGRDDIHAPGQFAIYAVRLQQLIPLNRDTFAGYDNSSGQLLRINVTSK